MENMAQRLELFGSMLSGDSIRVRAAEDVGGYRGDVILLPQTIDLFETPQANRTAYLFRVAYSVSSRALGFVARFEDSSENLADSADKIPDTLRKMADEWPSALQIGAELLFGCEADTVSDATWVEALSGSPLTGTLMPPFTESTVDADESETPTRNPTTTKEAKRRDFVRRREVPKEPESENPLVHSFEKVHTADEYVGGQKRVDGGDELEQHAAALDDLDMRDVVRSSHTVSSLYRADALIEGTLATKRAQEPPGQFSYDEWDDRKGVYRPGYCQLYEERTNPEAKSAEARAWFSETVQNRRAQIDALRAEICRVQLQWRAVNRQRDGGAVDIDAVVDGYATLSAGRTPDPRFYIRERRQSAELAALILLDVSLSSDSYTDGRRVLDVARESVAVFGEALDTLEQDVAIAGFYGNTRRNCRFSYLKDFDEPWEHAWQRLFAVSPSGYTRIGPAIRHGAHMLGQSHAKRQVLVVLSDAKPTDYDGYEGRHGVMDVHQAIAECHAARITTFGLVLSGERSNRYATMFGRGRFAMLPSAEHSATALTQLFTEWMHR